MKEIQIHPAPQPGQPDWCTCTYCREMPEGEKGIFLSSCMNNSKDLSFMATKNEDQTKYSHLENVKKIHI
jgi:hypothetical protein